LEEVDPELVGHVVRQVSGKEAAGLPDFIRAFRQIRFLYDYGEDGKLLSRLNGVMRRVGLPVLPDSLRDLLAEARRLVDAHRDALLECDPDPKR
jgi:hypothetical protein